MGEIGRPLREFARQMTTSAGPRAIAGAVAVIVLTGLTDGIGLVLLVPLLQSLGPQTGPAGTMAGTIARVMALAGLRPSLPSLLAVFLVLIGLRALLVRGREVTLARIRLAFVSGLRIRLYRAMAQASWPFLARSRASDLSATLLGEVDRVGQGTYFALHLPARALAILVHLMVAFTLAPGFSLLAVATGAGLAFAVRGRMLHSLRLGTSLTADKRELYRDFAEFVAAVKVAKAHAAEDRHVGAFSARVEDVARRMLAFSRGQADARFVQEVAGAAAVAAFLWGGATAAHLPPPQLLPLVLIFYRLLPLTQQLQQAAQQILHMLPSLASVIDTCVRCEAHAEPAAAGDMAPVCVRHGLRVEDLWFAHPGEAAPFVLRGVNLALPAGGITVLSGPSGGGKSTLLDLLVGLLEPARGRILVDGVPLSAVALPAWRRSIAYVPQDPVLFHDTIRANLLWARPEAGDAEIREVLTLAAAEFVYALPAGLETVVGDRGLLLSGGERQRLALARALLRRPTLLILDEATAALDSGNERFIADSIGRLKGRMTIVVVTHRPAAFTAADQILRMREGEVLPADPSSPIRTSPASLPTD